MNNEFKKHIYFTNDINYVLNRSIEKTLIIFRFIKHKTIAHDTGVLKKIRNRFQNVYYFDDTAGVDELNTSVFPYVDKYYKKQIHVDRNYYLKPSYGERIYSQYYHDKYNINDKVEHRRDGLKQEWIDKMELSWNLGIGCYPKLPLRNGIARRMHKYVGVKGLRPLYSRPQRFLNKSNVSINKISARYALGFHRETVAYHRNIYQDTVDKNSLFLTGRIPLKDYNRELTQVRATFSPFGWGEVCFRDFEAIINGSALIKPSMEHIETWPDIYKNNETYCAVDWDGNDLETVAGELMNDTNKIKQITENASFIFSEAYKNLDKRVEQIFFANI